MGITYNLNGFDELQRQLRRMSPRDSSRMAKIATRKSAKILLNEMRLRVPVRGGTLRRSLGLVSVRRRTPGAWFKVGARSGKRLKNDGWYAHLVEFPTRAHSTQKGDYLARTNRRAKQAAGGVDHPGTKSRPFMRPAVDASAKKIIDSIGIELGKAIEQFY